MKSGSNEIGYGEGIFQAEDFTKAQVVESIKKFIPNFEHEEKGKNLDQKM